TKFSGTSKRSSGKYWRTGSRKHQSWARYIHINRRICMKQAIIVAVALAALVALPAAGWAQAKPDFSGSWTMDAAKSDPAPARGGGGAPGGGGGGGAAGGGGGARGGGRGGGGGVPMMMTVK